MSRETAAFIAQVEGILNAPDPSQEPLAMWLRRTLEKYREADQMWERRIEESRAKNARIASLEKALSELIAASDIGDPNEMAAYEDEWLRAKAVLA